MVGVDLSKLEAIGQDLINITTKLPIGDAPVAVIREVADLVNSGILILKDGEINARKCQSSTHHC